MILSLLIIGFITLSGASVVEDVESKFWREKAGQPVPGQWIVLFNEQVANSEDGLARLQQHLNPLSSQTAGGRASAATSLAGAPLLSAAPLGADTHADAASDPLVKASGAAGRGRRGPLLSGAVLRFGGDALVEAAQATDGSREPEHIAAIRRSGIVKRVQQDRYVSIAAQQCVPGAALAGALPSAEPSVSWPGCATPATRLVWFGERCSFRFDRARYMGVYAVDRVTGEEVPGCIMVRNRTASFNTQWLGECGHAPAVAPTLPVSNICAPGAANAGAALAACVPAKDVAGGLTKTLTKDASCGGAKGRTVTFAGARCGPRGQFVRWGSFSLQDKTAEGAAGGAPASTCARAPAAEKGAGAGGLPAAAQQLLGQVAGGPRDPLMYNAEMVGSCGVPPMVEKGLPVELCADEDEEEGSEQQSAPARPSGPTLPLPAVVLPTEALSEGESVPWGISRIEALLAGNVTLPLTGAAVAVIDTGVDDTHPDIYVAGGKTWVESSFRDKNGHGTHVAGTIAATNNGSGVVGVSPGTPIYALRVLDGRGSGTFSSVVNALLWVAQYAQELGIKVVNMSLGGEGGDDPEDNVICDAVKEVIDAGVAVVAAAGNAGGGMPPKSWTTQLPVACANTIAVTAMDKDGNPATFSYFLSGAEAKRDARLRERTVAAPGVDVRSAWPRALSSSGYRTISGTSMASPHVAAVVARCFAAGVCTGGAQAADAVAAAAAARNAADEAYGFRGDPFFGRSSVGSDRYYGPLVHAGWRPASA